MGRKDKFGYTFKQAIFSGSKWTNSGVGVYAGSHDSYYAFAPLMDKIIWAYHGHAADAKHVSNMDASQLKCPDFPADEDKMINSTRIRVGRNLADYPLGTACTATERRQIEDKVTGALAKFTGDLKGKYYSLGGMTDAERKQLIADHFLFKGGDKYLESCGLERVARQPWYLPQRRQDFPRVGQRRGSIENHLHATRLQHQSRLRKTRQSCVFD